jgi:GrpB-like predicted nucleotidyltransferase (UPF0157 family)
MEASVPIAPHSITWKEKYENEEKAVRDIFNSFLIDIQHIGSTAIPDLLAKPIIDIAVLIESHKDAENFLVPLEKFGYVYKPELSSNERHFFQKGDPVQFHLSIAYVDQGGYWDRQILFRDYLMTHESSRREYEQIKQDSADKSEFVHEVLTLARGR